MNDNTNTTPSSETTYIFSINFRVGGMVDSPHDLEETRSRFEKMVIAQYGVGATLHEFREATAEEIEAFEQMISEYEVDEDGNPIDDLDNIAPKLN